MSVRRSWHDLSHNSCSRFNHRIASNPVWIPVACYNLFYASCPMPSGQMWCVIHAFSLFFLKIDHSSSLSLFRQRENPDDTHEQFLTFRPAAISRTTLNSPSLLPVQCEVPATHHAIGSTLPKPLNFTLIEPTWSLYCCHGDESYI